MKFFKTADARPLRRGLLDAELVLEQHVVVRRQPDACTHDVDKAVTLHTSTHTSTDSRLSRVIGSAGRGLARARWQLQTVGTAGLTGGDFTHALTEQKKTAGRRVDRGRLQGGAVLRPWVSRGASQPSPCSSAAGPATFLNPLHLPEK